MTTPPLGELFKHAKVLQERFAQLQEELGRKTVEASSGGGMVTVVANGRQEVLSIRLDPQLLSSSGGSPDLPMLQDLITAAVNEAIRQARALMADELKTLSGGVTLPGLF